MVYVRKEDGSVDVPNFEREREIEREQGYKTHEAASDIDTGRTTVLAWFQVHPIDEQE